VLLSAPAQAKTQECIAQAARFHSVNEIVLRAIAFHESSMKTWEIGRNTNGMLGQGSQGCVDRTRYPHSV